MCSGSGWKPHIVGGAAARIRQPLAARRLQWGPNNRWAKYVKQREFQEEARVAAKDAVEVEVGNGTLEMKRQMKNAGLQTDGMVRHATMAARNSEIETLILVSNINSVKLSRFSSKRIPAIVVCWSICIFGTGTVTVCENCMEP